jgi:NitT/TauT family transport system substrate-binding protein
MSTNSTSGRSKAPLLWSTLCGLALLAVPLGGSAIAAPGSGAQLRTVKVAILPLEPTAQVLYAKHRGFFRKQGLDVEIEVLNDPTQTAASVISGAVQFSAVNAGALASMEAREAPVRSVAAGALFDPKAKAKTSALVAMPGKRIRRARDLVGKRIAIDLENTIAHIGVLKWLKSNGVERDQVRFTTLPFAQMLGPLVRGDFDAALLPEPYLTLAEERGARHVAHPFDAVCSRQCLLTMWIARKDIDADLAARYRNAIQAAAVWANERRNDDTSAAILARYVPVKLALLRKTKRTLFATRLRVSLAQPWIDVFAEFGVIPKSFPAADLLK